MMKHITKEGGTKLFFLVLSFFLLIPLTSAEIFVGQTEQIYNIGDELKISFTLKPSYAISDFFVADLTCESSSVEIYRAAYALDANSEKTVDISTELGSFLSSSLGGECFVTGRYSNEQRSSQRFEINQKIQTSLNLDNFVLLPGDSVNVNGRASKNGKDLKNGFVELTISDINIGLVNSVKDGQFNFSFVIPSNALSGNHKIDIVIYEKDKSGNTINQGDTTETITIKQIIKSVDIALGTQEISPGEDLTYRILVYDQANEQASTSTALVFYSPGEKIFEKRLVQSDETNTFKTQSNYTSGYWKIEAKVGDLQVTKLFSIKELKAIAFSLENQTLTITNIGNVPYKNNVEVSIGNVKEIKEIKLALGESRKFKLAAPDGTYHIVATDGSNLQDFGSTFLTGRAISVDELGNVLSGNVFIIISLIVILLIAIFVLYLFRKVLRERALRKGKSKFSSLAITKPSLTPLKKSTPSISADMISKGEKQESATVVLQIKNAEEIAVSKEALAAIDSSLSKAKEEKAKVYSEGEFRIIVFAPILTKEQDNTLKAVRIAQTIQRILEEHNKRYAQKISFGIGVNAGELIIEFHEGKFKFTSVSNVIGSTKKLASLSNSEVILSESIRNKTAGKIKVEKISNSNLYKLARVIDRSAHEEFIKKFMQRQGSSKKLS